MVARSARRESWLAGTGLKHIDRGANAYYVGLMMRPLRGTYTGYSIGCAVVWAVILAAVSAAGASTTRHTILLVFGGWWIGWLSASIARSVYPPPRRHMHLP